MKKTFFIIVSIIILVVILVNIPNIIAHAKFYSFNHNKKVVTETRVVKPNDLFDLEMQSQHLREKLQDKTTRYSLIAKEMIKGENALNDDYEAVMNKQIKLKISMPVTTYKDSSGLIKFISGNPKILQIYVNGQWEDFNGSWVDLHEKLNS